ncbi:MAG: hypothetical protein KatS3mg052_2096 [Candidatus Roseilinea sp.]|nr:MAG: hypothetical protein KatS3mg052_2096 [Candidatus Roseilinea sp.]
MIAGMAHEPASSLTHLSATRLAALMARGEISATEVVRAHIARIETVNPKINALVVKRFDQALREAKAADDRRARGEPLPPLARCADHPQRVP